MKFEIKNEKGVLIDDSGNQVSWVIYENEGNSIHLVETHTAKGFEGRGFAGRVVKEMLDYSESNFQRIKISCPYIKRQIAKKDCKSDKIEYTELLKLKESIDFFNKYHEPEAKAEYVGYRDGLVKVRFSGYMCLTCGVYDYFEDIVVDINAEIVEYEEEEDGSFIVIYRLRRL